MKYSGLRLDIQSYSPAKQLEIVQYLDDNKINYCVEEKDELTILEMDTYDLIKSKTKINPLVAIGKIIKNLDPSLFYYNISGTVIKLDDSLYLKRGVPFNFVSYFSDRSIYLNLAGQKYHIKNITPNSYKYLFYIIPTDQLRALCFTGMFRDNDNLEKYCNYAAQRTMNYETNN